MTEAPAVEAPRSDAPDRPVAHAEAAAAFKALADPARLRLLEVLVRAEEPQCVCHLTPVLGLAQPTVSHHLRVLREAGLVTRERRGTWAYYAPDAAALGRVRALVPTAAPIEERGGRDAH